MKYSLLLILFTIQFSVVFPKALLEVSFSFSEGTPGDEIILKAGLDPAATDLIDDLLGEYEMPPLPPFGSFDVRFKLKGTNGILNDYRHVGTMDPEIVTHEYFVNAQLNGISTELTITYDITAAMEFQVADLSGAALCEVKKTGIGRIKIPANINSFIVKVTYNNPLKLTGIVDYPIQKPGEFSLEQNYPNPFNPETVISYQLSVISHVTLKVYDLPGKEIATLVNEEKAAGSYSVKFNADTYRGSRLAGGVYIYRLVINSDRIKSGSFTQNRKMLLLK